MMRLMIAAGATGVIMLWSWPAEAERRDESYQFCQGAPDLCVFVCRDGCPGMSTDYVCESRRGRLIVDEGGSRSYYEDDFSLCWHRSRPVDLPVPDPEDDHVPIWPGSDEGARCMGCRTKGDWCETSEDTHIDICRQRKKNHFERECKRTLAENGKAHGRNGKTFGFSNSCKVIIGNPEMYEDRRGGELGQEENPQVQRCKDEVVGRCLADYSQDHPDEQATNSFGLEVGEYFKVDAGHSSTIMWGGKIGFETACRMGGDLMSDECVSAEAACYRSLYERTSCRQYRRGGSR